MPAPGSGITLLPWEALLIPSPIRRALSTIRTHRVAHLLMGGQACVLYGAAEFSRDLDRGVTVSLAVGTRLGPSEVAAQIGAGGIGEVLSHPNIARASCRRCASA
jgi:hypothetical protein